jgi:hypothetical protein
MPVMGKTGGSAAATDPDDAALRAASERAAVDWLLATFPDLKDGLAGRFWRGEIDLRARVGPDPRPAPSDEDGPAPGSGTEAGPVPG